MKTIGRMLLAVLVASFAIGAYVGSRAGFAFAARRRELNGKNGKGAPA